MKGEKVWHYAVPLCAWLALLCAAHFTWGDPPLDKDGHAICPDCGCLEDAVLPDYCNGIQPASAAASCKWMSQHPRKEHTQYAFERWYHCAALGGQLVGGVSDASCRATRGIFSAAPNLRAELGKDRLDQVAMDCSKASGIPPAVLLTGLYLDEHEYTLGEHCPHYASWSLWNAPDPDAVDAPGMDPVPDACWKESL